MKNLLLLTGGVSGEHDVSVKSRNYIKGLIDQNEYNIINILIAKDGTWFLQPNSTESNAVICHLINKNNKPAILDDLGNILYFDLVFPLVLGDAENGSLPGLFESLNIPYVGTRVLGSAMCFDKIFSKILTKSYDINNVPFIQYDEQINYQNAVKILNCDQFFIKPSNSGSTLGASKATNDEEFNKAILEAKKYGNRILIEQFFSSMRELFCSVCLIDGKLVPSVIGEALTYGRVFDYKLKYQYNLINFANIPKEMTEQIQECSLKIFKILECETFARIDFFLKDGKIYFSEVNTIPAMTNTSIFLKLLQGTGYKPAYVINQLLKNAK